MGLMQRNRRFEFKLGHYRLSLVGVVGPHSDCSGLGLGSVTPYSRLNLSQISLSVQLLERVPNPS
jgi:hypothetical protein